MLALCWPTISVRASRLASFIFFTLLKWLRSASFALGPMPLISSSSECKACLECDGVSVYFVLNLCEDFE